MTAMESALKSARQKPLSKLALKFAVCMGIYLL
jgi:hypothetical protein